MKAAIDKHVWKQLLNLPDVEIAAWVGPDEHLWSIAELRSLFGSTPPGMTVYIWKFHAPVHPVTQLRAQKRSFFYTNEIWSRIVYSSDVTLQGRSLWFDLAILDQGCAEDLLEQLKGGQFHMSTGLVIEKDETSVEEVGAAIASTILQAWDQQSAQVRPLEWTDETWQAVRRSLPGVFCFAPDSNCRHYFVILAESMIPWLMSRSTGKLDLEALWGIGVDIGMPRQPF